MTPLLSARASCVSGCVLLKTVVYATVPTATAPLFHAMHPIPRRNVCSQPFYIRMLCRAAAHKVLLAHRTPRNDFGIVARANRRSTQLLTPTPLRKES